MGVGASTSPCSLFPLGAWPMGTAGGSPGPFSHTLLACLEPGVTRPLPEGLFPRWSDPVQTDAPVPRTSLAWTQRFARPQGATALSRFEFSVSAAWAAGFPKVHGISPSALGNDRGQGEFPTLDTFPKKGCTPSRGPLLHCLYFYIRKSTLGSNFSGSCNPTTQGAPQEEPEHTAPSHRLSGSLPSVCHSPSPRARSLQSTGVGEGEAY